MSIVYRFAAVLLLLLAPAFCLAQSFRQPMAQPTGQPEEGPSVETLRRMAKQLGTGQNNLPNIDPKTLELAREFLKNNPQILDDPDMKARIEAMKQQMQQNPEAFRKQFEQNNTLTKDQLDQFRKNFENRPKTNTDVPELPKVDTNTGQTDPKNGDPWTNPPIIPKQNPKLDPNPKQGNTNDPLTQQQLKEQQARNSEGFRNMAGLWEKNVGSLDKTPAMKQTLMDMFGGTGGQGKGFGNGSFGNTRFGNNNGSSSGIANWFKNRTWNGSPPSWWSNMNLGSRFNFGGNMPSFGAPAAPSFGGGGFAMGGITGLGTIGIVIVAILVAAVIAFVLYRYWPQIQAMRSKPSALPGAGEWTIDPRDVRDRNTLITAFEYVSVFLCGNSAKVWNHATIAAAFVDRIPKSAGYAEPLARLYARARYTPEHEVFTPADIAEARGYLCQLAGVPNE